MKSCFIILAIILNCTININSYSLSMSINIKYKKLFTDSYLELKPTKMLLQDTKVCELCKERINIKREIPYNCTIPLGCPFNKNTKSTIEDTFKG